MSKYSNPDLQGWHRNTELCVDLKTTLRMDFIAGFGKQYQGQLTRDSEDHFSFVETLPTTDGKRNPHVFRGRYITVTRRDDGTLRPNFRPLKVEAGFNLERYAIGVSNELLWALGGLIER